MAGQPAAVRLPQISPARIRSYYRSLPFFTRICFILILAALVLELQPFTSWSVVQWGALIPNEINIGTRMTSESPITSVRLSDRAP